MRFDRFELTRFGHFTDAVLDFPAPDTGPDLHLILGANEAGKSTFRDAVGELLFGFDRTTPYNFHHDYADLLLGAVLRNGRTAEAVQRIKKTRDTLRRPDGSVLPDGHLAPLLGAMDKATLARELALDHAALVAGGRRLLENRDDLSRLLFEAASGIADIAALQRDLEGRAAARWSRDGRARSAYREAAQAFRDATRARNEAVTTAPTWEKLRRALAKAADARDRARAAWAALEAERATLERLRRTATIIARLDQIEAERAALSPGDTPPPRLPADAAERLDRGRQREAELRLELDHRSRDRDAAVSERDTVETDDAVLSLAAEIRALNEEMVQVRRHPDDIDKRQGEIRRFLDQALGHARHIGWDVTDRDALTARLPARIDREALDAHRQEHDARDERVRHRREAVSAREEELEALRARLAALPDMPPDEDLREAVEAARALGETELRRDDLAATAESARRDLDALQAGLAPWSGDLDTLAALAMPTIEEMEARQRDGAARAQRREAQQERLAEIERSLAEKHAEAAARRARSSLVDQDALKAAREARDALWRAIRDGTTPLEGAASGYEAAVRDADDLADRRLAQAEAVAAADQLDTDIATLEAQRAHSVAALNGLRAEIERAERDWETAMGALGVPGLTPARLRDWADRRRRTLEAWRRAEEARAALGRFDARIDAAATALRRALGDADGADRTLPSLLRRAEARLQEHARVTDERSKGAEARRDLERRLEAERRMLATAEAEWAEWTHAWEAGLDACELPRELPAPAVADALRRMREIDDALDDIRTIETDRIATMKRDLDTFARNVARCAESLGRSADGAPREIARALSARLAAAEQARDRRRSLDTRIAQIDSQMQQARDGLEALRAGLAPLFEAAGIADTTDIEALAAAVRRSDVLREVEARRRATMEELTAAADGHAIDALREALAATPPERRDTRLAALEDEQQAAQASLEAATEAYAEARAALDAAGAGGETGVAARAEEDRQQAIAAMATAAGDHLDLWLEARLLRWAIDRYRAENQSPLLARATGLFRDLTLGAFAELLVDVDSDPPVLRARRASGALVPIEGLSDGTRDQLFLALRLAAVDLQLDRGPALPVIADDLFINCDDQRAAAGFRVLAGIARRTQVLYLSHHDHLADVARSVLGPELSVLRLDGDVDRVERSGTRGS